MKKNLTLIAITLTAFVAISYTASAQVSAVSAQQGLTTFASLIATFNNTVVKALGTLFISGAVVAFFFGVARFVWGLREGKEADITNGKQFMIWSLVGLFVMFSVYGIIKVTQSLVPGLNATSITIPDFNYGGATPNANTGTNPLAPTPNANTGTTGNSPSSYQATPNANTGTTGNNPSSYQATPDANQGYTSDGP